MPYLYPHTDLNQQNLDWVIEQIAALRQAIGSIALSAGNLSIAWDSSEMTDHNVIYLYMGVEVGFIHGYLYEWNPGSQSWSGQGRLIPDLPVPIVNGGTGASTKATARAALEITPANIGAEPAFTKLPINKGGTNATSASDALTNLGAQAALTSSNPLAITAGGTGSTDAAGARTALGIGAVATENTLPVSKGGTGANAAAAARTNLGIGSVAVENTVPISKGGTGATSLAAAQTALGMIVNGATLLTNEATDLVSTYDALPSPRGFFIGFYSAGAGNAPDAVNGGYVMMFKSNANYGEMIAFQSDGVKYRTKTATWNTWATL